MNGTYLVYPTVTVVQCGGVNGTYLVYPTVAVVQWWWSERYISRMHDWQWCSSGE